MAGLPRRSDPDPSLSRHADDRPSDRHHHHAAASFLEPGDGTSAQTTTVAAFREHEQADPL
jgi:hypothetical protein